MDETFADWPWLPWLPWLRWLSWVLVALFTGCCFASNTQSERYLVYRGTAVDRHTLNFLYEERHWLLYREERLTERVVLYSCRDGSAFARKSVGYGDPLAPDFRLEDASTGFEEGIRSDGSQRSVFFRKNGSAPEKSAPLPQDQKLVADAGFDDFIQANWSTLMRDGAMPLHFLVPSRLDDMDFELRHVRSGNFAGQPAEVFRLKLAGALGLIAPSIEVTYRRADQVLMRYDGVSDLRDRAGDNYKSLISFAPGDRLEGDAQQMAAARQAPLAPCR